MQGRKVWSVKLPHSVLCIEKMDIPSRGLFLVAVALASNHVLVYNDKNVVDCFKMDDTVSAMKFGRFGREENTLVLGKLQGLRKHLVKLKDRYNRQNSLY